MPDTRGRGAGEGRYNPTGAVDAATAQYRWSYLPGEPDAVKAARPGSGRGGWKRDNHSSDVDHTRWPPTSIKLSASFRAATCEVPVHRRAQSAVLRHVVVPGPGCFGQRLLCLVPAGSERAPARRCQARSPNPADLPGTPPG